MSETASEAQGSAPVPSGCPVADWFNPGETSAHSDPFPWYARTREVGPIFFAPPLNMFVASRYEEVTAVLKDAVTYSNADSLGPELPNPAQPLPPEVAAEAGEDWNYGLRSTLTVLDPPRHTRVRKLVAPSFTPRRIRQFEETVREIAGDRIGGFAAAGRADLASEFAYQIPNMIIARIMGMPDIAADKFVDWTNAFLELLQGASGEEAIPYWRLLVEQHEFSREFIEERRAHPGNDLTTDMIQSESEDGEGHLTDEEILANTIGFVGAGSETSAIMMLNAVYLLLKHPDQWEAVKADASLIPAALEESLRLRAPARGLVRIVTKDVTLGGVEIPAGSRLLLNLASASHDEAVFERPDEFDIQRPNLDKHLAFGKWAHFCIGAPLARLEGRVALECLREQLPDLRLAPEQGPLQYGDSALIPPVKELLVEW